MKIAFSLTALAFASLTAAVTHVAGRGDQTDHNGQQPEHDLRTYTDEKGYTLLIDNQNNEYAGIDAGISGVDGIYNAGEQYPVTKTSGVDMWQDVHNGYKFAYDYANPERIVIYDPDNKPIWTQTQSQAQPHSTPPATRTSADTEHKIMKFENNDGIVLLVDPAQPNVGILEGAGSGIDGIYSANGYYAGSKTTGIDTWVDSADGIQAVIDYANPNHYTVYDSNNSPIQTIHAEPAATPAPTSDPQNHHKRSLSHSMHTLTNDSNETILYDVAVPHVGVFIEGQDGVDGIYSRIPAPTPGEPHTLETWADNEGNYAVFDNANPYIYTEFDASNNVVSVVTLSSPTDTPSEEAEHHLRTFVNQRSEALLVDYAVSDLGVLQMGVDGVDGIYNINEASDSGYGTDTWINDYDGIKAVIDNANPHHYTVYDMSNDEPIYTYGG
ncbi:hypothetical protein GGI07_004147 [Coemansia sp. Benny D115]|nr:hypothetical protein GGI07_004147 [Coemansia sp. Benny D115]